MKMNTLADALSVIKNAESSGKLECRVKPASKLIGEVLRVMKEENYIGGFEYIVDGKGGIYSIDLVGNINNCNVINPRFEVRKKDFEKWEKRFLPGRNFGLLILTTSRGIMPHNEAKEKGLGGQLLAYIY